MSLNNPKEVWEKQLTEIFTKKQPTEMEQIINIASMILYVNETNKDMGALYSKVGLEAFTQTIELFSGRTVRFMKKENLREYLLLAVCYYYREFKKLDWNEIQKILPYDINTVSIGIKIKNLSKNIKKELDNYFKIVEEKHEKERV